MLNKMLEDAIFTALNNHGWVDKSADWPKTFVLPSWAFSQLLDTLQITPELVQGYLLVRVGVYRIRKEEPEGDFLAPLYQVLAQRDDSRAKE